MRRYSREVKIGKVKIGGNNPIAVQSMLNVPSHDIQKNVEQAIKLKEIGCDILRIAIPDKESIQLIDAIKSKVDIPLVADIHFDYKLALEATYAGIDKIRINPGNIGNEEKIKQVAKVCREKDIPIRIGVNSGSIEPHLLKKYGAPTAEAMVQSAIYNVKILEKFDFNNIVISIKSPSVIKTVEAYKIIAKECDYPLHIGITEAGTEAMGVIKSSIGIGSLLLDGIGDTIRVSLTDYPSKEVKTGINILKSIDMYAKRGIEFISCPTCGRTKIDLIKIAKETEKALKGSNKNLKVAIMGCIVNGPGEAKDADIGITGADGLGIIFKKGKVIKKVPEENLVEELVKEIESM